MKYLCVQLLDLHIKLVKILKIGQSAGKFYILGDNHFALSSTAPPLKGYVASGLGRNSVKSLNDHTPTSRVNI